MPEFQWVKSPVFSPTICFTCNTHKHEDGFIDTLTSDVGGRRLYLCASCVYTAAQKMGCLSPDQTARLKADALVVGQAFREATRQLVQAEQNRVVPLNEVMDELSRRRGGRPPKAAA